MVKNEDDAAQSRGDQAGANQRKDHFYDFPSDDESMTSTHTVEVEAANYFIKYCKGAGLYSQVSDYQITVSEA